MSQGGGAERYEGTILKVTDPRASRNNLEIRKGQVMYQNHEIKIPQT